MVAVAIVLAIISTLYAVISIRKKRNNSKRMKARVENNRAVRAVKLMTEVCIKDIARKLSDTKEGGTVDGIKQIMAQRGVTPETLNRKEVINLLNDLASRYASRKLYAPITEENGSLLIDFVYDSLQIAFETGPAYEKFKKSVSQKMANVSKAEIEDYLRKNYSGEINDRLINDIKKNMASDMTDKMSRNMQNRMQEDMRSQMQADMQNQMQIDMQNQMQMNMQNQMQLDMQMQMQNQMMMDMQMQMQNQMQMDMQMQMQNQMMMDMQNNMVNQMQQSQMDLANTMHQSEMAITPMHDGGFMNDMNNMHMGGM